MKLPGGLLVTGTDGTGPLAPGDVVVLAGGEPVVGPQVVQRALALSGGRPVPLVVARGEERVELSIKTGTAPR
jgi:hypothetical protein